jgi:hypothetical protein
MEKAERQQYLKVSRERERESEGGGEREREDLK